MATRYVWDVSKQTDEVIRLWWIPFLIPHKAKFGLDNGVGNKYSAFIALSSSVGAAIGESIGRIQ
jgi:hypothetical protein